MRISAVLLALGGGARVLALNPRLLRRNDSQPVDLTPFLANSFDLVSPEQAKADAEKSGVFQPRPDHGTSGASGKFTAGNSTTCTQPDIRTEWRNMAESDRLAFVDAVKCLLNRPSAGSNFPGSHNRYEDLVSAHQQKQSVIHMVGQFLPWHRYFLSVYESLLRDECSYAGPMPWWDETKDAGNFARAPLFTDAYFGPLPMRTPRGEGSCVASGPFAMTLHIGPGSENVDHCLSRALDEGLSAQCNEAFVNYCNSYTNYGDMASCAETGPHAYGHNGIGAVMSDVAASPGDPLFFMHHCFVDHGWRIWQNANPDKLYQVGGYTTQDQQQPLTLDYVLTTLGIRPDVTVRDVMDTTGGYLCYRYDY